MVGLESKGSIIKHTALTDKEVGGVIDHADNSVTNAKIVSVDASKITSGVLNKARIPVLDIDTELSSPSRELDTVYQNDSDTSLLVCVTVSSLIQDVGDQAFATAKIGSSAGDLTELCSCGLSWSQPDIGAMGLVAHFPLTFWVPPHYYFSVTTYIVGTGMVSVMYWNETSLSTS